MAVDLILNLDPVSQSGLTVTAKVYTGSTLAGTVSASESPAASARYTGSFSAGNSTRYDVTFLSESGIVGHGSFETDASGNEVRPLTAQQTADALKLAPTAGTAATGSVYNAIASAKSDIIAAIPDASAGDGDILVDHNYGGTDELKIVADDGETPVDDARIRAYVKSAYDAGTIDPNPPTTYTGSDGHWIEPLMLDADTYYLAVFNPATRRTKRFEVEVT